jgi:1,4-alpha-glucan branching enzyme
VNAVYEVHSAAAPFAAEHSQRLGFDRVVPVGEDPDEPPWDRPWAELLLRYVGRDPIHRRWHHDELVSRAAGTNRTLPLSLLICGGSLLDCIWGDDLQKRAQLRALLAFAWACPGDKHVFMGASYGSGVEHAIGDLNRILREEEALRDGGFTWVEEHAADESAATFLRRGKDADVLCAFHFTPVPRPNHRVGVPSGGVWTEILDTDAGEYGGSGHGNLGSVEAAPVPLHGFPFSLTLTLPPFGAVWLARRR